MSLDECMSQIYDLLDAVSTDPDITLSELLESFRSLRNDLAASIERLEQS